MCENIVRVDSNNFNIKKLCFYKYQDLKNVKC